MVRSDEYLSLAAKPYPPKGDDGLYQLHRKICESHSSVHQKLSVFYYLLLDFNEHLGTQTRTSFADIFAGRFAVPKKYETFMKGLWNMDRHQFTVRAPPLRPQVTWTADRIVARANWITCVCSSP